MVAKLRHVLRIQEFHPNIYLGGSIALILQEAIPDRFVHDIDLISKDNIKIWDIFEEAPRISHGWSYKYHGEKFEVFYNASAQYIEYSFEDKILKLSPVDEIMAWKILRTQRKGRTGEKHREDYNEYLKNIE